jgi:hypothetical protein
MKNLLLIVPTTLDVSLFGAKSFFTDGKKCWEHLINGKKGKLIHKPDWYSLPLD